MPKGAPKKFTAFRLDPALLLAVQAAAEAQATSVTAAVEEGLRLWLARQKRRAGKDSLARHLAPPTRREVAARAAAEPAPATPYRRPKARETAPRKGAG
jgi:hypothetical protein